MTDHQFHWGCTHCLPPVAGSSTYLSKYNRTSRSLSSGPGKAKFTISSMRSLMAQSNCSGWLLAKTSMNLSGRNHTCVDKAEPRVQQFNICEQISLYLLLCSPVRYKKALRVALRSSLIFSWKTESTPTVRFQKAAQGLIQKCADLLWISYEGMRQLHQRKAEVCNRVKTTNFTWWVRVCRS